MIKSLQNELGSMRNRLWKVEDEMNIQRAESRNARDDILPTVGLSQKRRGAVSFTAEDFAR